VVIPAAEPISLQDLLIQEEGLTREEEAVEEDLPNQEEVITN
jgi:hypothetical protein